MKAVSLITFLILFTHNDMFASTRFFDLHTDKSIYLNGEQIQLAAFLHSPFQKTMDSVNTVVYVELLGKENEILERILLYSENGLASGMLSIPAKVASGVYQLRAYTLSHDKDYYDVVLKTIKLVAGSSSTIGMVGNQQDTVAIELPMRLTGDRTVKGLFSISAVSSNNQPTGKEILLIAQALSKDIEVPPIRSQSGIPLSGTVYNSDNIPEPFADVTIFSQAGDLLKGKTDSNGRFYTDQLLHYDSVEVNILATNGKKGILDIFLDPLLSLSKGNLYKGNLDSLQSNFAVAPAIAGRQKLTGKLLKEVEIKVRKDANEDRRSRMYDVNFGNTIDMKDIPPGYINVFDVLKGRIAGVEVKDNTIKIRNSPYAPLILVDEMPWEAEQAAMIPANWIDFIDVLKGPEAAIYGSKGGGGVIAIYTKRGEFLDTVPSGGALKVLYPGIQKPRSFKVSDLPETDDVPKTWYWEPAARINDGVIRGRFIVERGKSYQVQVEGMLDNGTTVIGSCVIKPNN